MPLGRSVRSYGDPACETARSRATTIIAIIPRCSPELDVIHDAGLDMKRAALRLNCSRSTIKLIAKEPRALAALNETREAGKNPLRGRSFDSGNPVHATVGQHSHSSWDLLVPTHEYPRMGRTIGHILYDDTCGFCGLGAQTPGRWCRALR